MIWGPIINSAAIILGALAGTMLGNIVPKEFRSNLMLVFGCIGTGLGVFMISKGNALPPVVAAIIFGSVCGELLHIEKGVNFFARKGSALFARNKTSHSAFNNELQDQFSIFTVVFCFSGLGFFGSMREGMTGDASLLLVKALLDFPTALIAAANVGAVVGLLAAPQFAIQAIVLLFATALVPLTSPVMLKDFTACGGFIMVATGLRMCNIAPFPILSMLPALLFVMPLSALWEYFLP